LPAKLIALTGPTLEAAGQVTLIVDNFVYVSGQFAFTKGSVGTGVLKDTLGRAIPGAYNLMTIGGSGINVFVGNGDPDSNQDGAFDGADDPAANGAVGVKLVNLEVALALFSPVVAVGTANTRASYYAITASADNIALVGVDGVTAQGSDILLQVNAASPARGGATPTAPPPAINFLASFPMAGGSTSALAGAGLRVFIGPDPDGDGPLEAPSKTIQFDKTLVAVAGTIDLKFDFDGDQVDDVSLHTTIQFQQTLRANNTKAIQISLTDTRLVLGGPTPLLDLTIPQGLIFIGNNGVAASFDLGNLSLDLDGVHVSGGLQFTLSTIPTKNFDETFIVDRDQFDNDGDGSIDEAGESVRLQIKDGGPYLRISGKVDVRIAIGGDADTAPPEFTLHGDFVFEQITVRPATLSAPAVKAIRVGAANVAATVFDPNSRQYVSFADGLGGFLITTSVVGNTTVRGIAGTLALTTNVSLGAVTAGGRVVLELNNTGAAVEQTIRVGDQNILIRFTAQEGRILRFAIFDAGFDFAPYFSVSGDFTRSSDAIYTYYGARNVSIFLGYVPDGGSYLGGDGQVKSGAIGLLIVDATLAMAERDGPTPGTKLRAVYATGQASLIGLDGLTITGRITVRISNLGQAIDKQIALPNDPAKPPPTTPESIHLQIGSGQIEQFSIGFNESGEIVGTDRVLISAAGIFTLSGAVQFTRAPNGRIDVDLPEATVDINLPDGDGQLQAAFGITGAARFFFGGVEGFQLQSLQVRGYSLFGQTATIAPAASSLLPVSADLAGPFNGSIVAAENFSELKVYFRDVNRVGLDASSIEDAGDEILVNAYKADGSFLRSFDVNGAARKLTSGTNSTTWVYALTTDAAAALRAAVASDSRLTLEVQFLANSWTDALGKTNGTEIERFTVYSTIKPVLDAPYAVLASPFTGEVVSKSGLNTKRYIDFSFFDPSGGVVDLASLADDAPELKITGAGAANVAIDTTTGFALGSWTQLSASTYRFTLLTKAGVLPAQTFVDGDVRVELVANSWTVGNGARVGQVLRETFTVSGAVAGAAAATNPITIGPMVIDGPTVGLVKTGFKDGKLVLSIGIGANSAGLNFGAGGVTAEFTGLLGTFDVTVDILKAVTALTQGGSLVEAFDVPGKFQIDIAGLKVVVPGAVEVTASGIVAKYDPHYRAEKNNNLPQQYLIVQTATVSFPRFGVTGIIAPSQGVPGLVIYDGGFKLGEATLIYKPGAANNSLSQAPATTASTPIRFGSLLEFDDLRIGVKNFQMDFRSGVTVQGTIFVASGGARFLAGKPVSATLSDRLTPETPAQDSSGTEAVRLGLEFGADGTVKAFVFKVDSLKITLSQFVTLTATDLQINTGAADNEELISFARVGAEVSIGSLKIGGEARNFAFLGDGSFLAKAGFGVFLSVGSADGASFKWPTWMPIKITEIGIVWPGTNLRDDPANFQLILSAAVSGIQGMEGLEFSGAIEGIVIDVGLLLQGKFPVIDIRAIAVTIAGDLFGGRISAGLIGGILKIGQANQPLDSFDTSSPVKDRIFFIGVEGGFEFAGIGGFTIRFAVSELGPLGVFIAGSVPGGILLEPNTGLSINDFSAGVEFFKTLPSIDQPEQLRGPAFQLPTAQSADQWLDGVKQQVITQYLAIQADPSRDGFTAAFTSPMLITGGAKLFSMHTSKETFNGEVIIRFSTDGKFLVIGKLNFASDNLSISARLYADLSKIAAGEATVLMLADIPDQVQLLTINGRFKMGFRNAAGEEAVFSVVDPQTGKPYARLAGPVDGAVVGAGVVNGRGYLDVAFPASSGQLAVAGSTVEVTGALNAASITDLSPEFSLVNAPGTLQLDKALAPVQMQGSTFRFWTTGDPGTTSPLQIEFIKETFSYAASNGELRFNQLENRLSTGWIAAPFIDILYIASAGGQITDAHLQTIAALGGPAVLRLQDRSDDSLTRQIPAFRDGTGNPLVLGNGKVRYFLAGPLPAGSYGVVLDAAIWADSTGTTNSAKDYGFTLASPQVSVSAPFSDGKRFIDVNVANGQVSGRHIDLNFAPTPGAQLNYASILDDA
jgi:hypothetical protein